MANGRAAAFLCRGSVPAFRMRDALSVRSCENGGEKLGHGSGGMELLRAA